VRRATSLLALALLAGCYHLRFERPSVIAEGGAPREQWHHGALGGTFDASGPVDLAAACPDGFARVENKVTFFYWLGQAFSTLGVLAPFHAPLWNPSGVYVICARPTAVGAPGARLLKLVLLPLTPKGDVKKETVAVFDEALAGELRRRPGISVLSESDVAALLGVEKKRQMLSGCSDSGCLAELGGALGADRVVHGSVGRVGNSLVVTISSLDAPKSRTVAGVSERLQGAGDEAFLDALTAMVDKLLSEPRPEPRPAAPPAAGTRPTDQPPPAPRPAR
jgi:hypothetical protein